MKTETQKYSERCQERCRGEYVISRFFEQVFLMHDRGLAKEWVDSEEFYIYLENTSIVCYKEGYFRYKDKSYKFLFDMTHINNLCTSLSEEIEWRTHSK